MLALILDEIVHITILSYMHALIFRMLVEERLELVGVHVLQTFVRNGIVQQGDVLRNGDTLVSRHILISQFKAGVQNFLTGGLLTDSEESSLSILDTVAGENPALSAISLIVAMTIYLLLVDES